MSNRCEACVIGLIRPEVRRFAVQMDLKMKKHDLDFGNSWACLSMKNPKDRDYLFDGLVGEMMELFSAIYEGKPTGDVASEAADVANFAMFIAENYKNRFRSERQKVEDEIRAGYIADRLGGE